MTRSLGVGAAGIAQVRLDPAPIPADEPRGSSGYKFHSFVNSSCFHLNVLVLDFRTHRLPAFQPVAHGGLDYLGIAKGFECSCCVTFMTLGKLQLSENAAALGELSHEVLDSRKGAFDYLDLMRSGDPSLLLEGPFELSEVKVLSELV